jgi:8-oxo-dGTP diphosphatase
MEDVYHLGIKALIRNGAGQIMLLQVNPKELSGDNPPYWDLPGGRIQRGETVLDALKREVEEETGLTDIVVGQNLGMILSNIRIPLKRQSDIGLILSIYECKIPANADLTLSFEHLAHRWCSPKQAAELLGHKFPDEFLAKIAGL